MRKTSGKGGGVSDASGAARSKPSTAKAAVAVAAERIELSDEEIICTFMEPRPPDGRGERVETEGVRWWEYNYQSLPKPSGVGKEFHWQWHPRSLTLDALHEVEERLTDEVQRLAYWLELVKGDLPRSGGYWRIAHANAKRKIMALAEALRMPRDE
jgi:hypothetical protein